MQPQPFLPHRQTQLHVESVPRTCPSEKRSRIDQYETMSTCTLSTVIVWQRSTTTSISPILINGNSIPFERQKNHQLHRHTADPSPLDLGCNNRQAFSPPSRPHNFPKEQADRHSSERTSSTFGSRKLPTQSFLLAYSLSYH